MRTDLADAVERLIEIRVMSEDKCGSDEERPSFETTRLTIEQLPVRVDGLVV